MKDCRAYKHNPYFRYNCGHGDREDAIPATLPLALHMRGLAEPPTPGMELDVQCSNCMAKLGKHGQLKLIRRIIRRLSLRRLDTMTNATVLGVFVPQVPPQTPLTLAVILHQLSRSARREPSLDVMWTTQCFAKETERVFRFCGKQCEEFFSVVQRVLGLTFECMDIEMMVDVCAITKAEDSFAAIAELWGCLSNAFLSANNALGVATETEKTEHVRAVHEAVRDLLESALLYSAFILSPLQTNFRYLGLKALKKLTAKRNILAAPEPGNPVMRRSIVQAGELCRNFKIEIYALRQIHEGRPSEKLGLQTLSEHVKTLHASANAVNAAHNMKAQPWGNTDDIFSVEQLKKEDPGSERDRDEKKPTPGILRRMNGMVFR